MDAFEQLSSITHNRPNAIRHITNGVTDWLWVAFGWFTLAFLGMVVWTWTRPRGTRLFHHLAEIILVVSAICYFGMASDLGATPVVPEFKLNKGATRQVWFVRYIMWFINFPLLILLLLLPSGYSLTDILTVGFFSWVVVISGLVGALIPSSYKWGFYAFGLVSLFFIWFHLLGWGPRTDFHAGSAVRSNYIRGAAFVCVITLVYPIAWACNEGSNIVSPNGEMIWYSVLDLLLGPIFLYWFIWTLRGVDYAAIGLRSSKWADGVGYGENGHPGVGPGAAAGAAPATGGPGMTTTGGQGATGATQGATTTEQPAGAERV